MNTAYIIDAARTPRGIGKPGKGALAGMHPQHLLSTVLKAIAERNNLNTADVDDVIIGCSMQQGTQDNDIARMSLLDAGWDIKASGVTIDRFCGSGISSVNMAAASIMSGMEDLTVGGGVEMMSLGASFNMQPIMDANNLRLRELHPQSHQGVCADAIATLEGITRADVDALSVQSQERAAHALANGHFDKGVVPVSDEAGNILLAQDEYPRAGTTFETLSQLNPAFGQLADYPLDDTGVTYRGLIEKTYPDLEINHIHHAGNSSGIVDGAAAILLASEDYVKKNNLKPRAKIIAMANMGDSPELMLNAPVAATKKVLAKAGMTIDDGESGGLVGSERQQGKMAGEGDSGRLGGACCFLGPELRAGSQADVAQADEDGKRMGRLGSASEEQKRTMDSNASVLAQLLAIQEAQARHMGVPRPDGVGLGGMGSKGVGGSADGFCKERRRLAC